MSVAAEIADMKAQLRVGTDRALAGALCLDRTNISLWRTRGRVSASAKRRARMIAQYGQLPEGDSIEAVIADIAVLSDRLSEGRMNAGKLADALDALSARTRAVQEVAPC